MGRRRKPVVERIESLAEAKAKRGKLPAQIAKARAKLKSLETRLWAMDYAISFFERPGHDGRPFVWLPESRNYDDERDMFMYNERMLPKPTKWVLIRRKVNSKKAWTPLNSDAAARKALVRFCENHSPELATPPDSRRKKRK